jgi:hypothetical protein
MSVRIARSWRSALTGSKVRLNTATLTAPGRRRAGERGVTDAVAAVPRHALRQQIAQCYHRADAVEQLIDETKVWSYWPYREHMLTTQADPGAPADLAAQAIETLRARARSASIGTWRSCSLAAVRHDREADDRAGRSGAACTSSRGGATGPGA